MSLQCSCHDDAARFSLYWGGRFTTTKGGETSIRQYLQFLMGGRDVDIYCTAVGGANRLRQLLRHYGARDALHLMEGLPYEQAQRVMKRCHASIFYQLNPGASAPYEQMYAGLVVMFKRFGFPEEPEMYPPDYPFLFRDDAECATMLRWVYEHLEEAQRQLAGVKTREWVKLHTDKILGANRILDVVEARVPPGLYQRGYRLYDETVQLVGKALEACRDVDEGPVKLERLCDAINRLKGRVIVQQGWGLGLKGLTPFSIRRTFVPAAGWRDICEGPDVEFVQASQAAHAA